MVQLTISGEGKTPLIEDSLYPALTVSKVVEQLTVKARLVQLTISGEEKTPLIEDSLYPALTVSKAVEQLTEDLLYSIALSEIFNQRATINEKPA